MKPQINITTKGGQITIAAPFSDSNNTQFRARGGKFQTGRWVFGDTPAVGAMIGELFGEQDSPWVLARVPIDKAEADGSRIQIGGYVLGERKGRDQAVRSPEGVQLYSGSWRPSGGSVKSPRVTGHDVVLDVVMRQDFADRHGLEIISSLRRVESEAAEAEPPDAPNPLAGFTLEELQAEIARRRGA